MLSSPVEKDTETDMGDSQPHCHDRDNDSDSQGHEMAVQNLTNFSIDEILKPDFGVKKFTVRIGSAFSPVDLKRRSTSPSLSPAPRESALPPPGKTEVKPAQVWPAWVYCTRYSDRPSSGRPGTLYSNNQSGSKTLKSNI